MKKTLLVTVIAIVLVLSIAGTCFALYKTTPNNKTVNISATAGDTCNLTIGTSTSLDFSGISPAEGHTSKTVDVTLSTSNGALADGVHGIFKVAKTGDLAAYIDVTVNEIPSVGGTLGSAVADATTAQGLDIALSATPKYYRITMALSAAAIADFSLAAEKTGSITVTWAVNDASVFSYDANAYYVVGTLNGVTAWYPTSNSIVLNDTPTGSNIAQKNAITLHAGDSFRVVKNYKDGAIWYGGKADNANNPAGVAVSSPDGNGYNIDITTDGTYYIFLNGENRIWVSDQP